jgi:hypothetical protein
VIEAMRNPARFKSGPSAPIFVAFTTSCPHLGSRVPPPPPVPAAAARKLHRSRHLDGCFFNYVVGRYPADRRGGLGHWFAVEKDCASAI